MKRIIFYLTIILIFFSCKQHYVQTIIQMDIGKKIDQNLISKTKKEIVNRLKESGFKNVNIKSNEYPDQLIVESNINSEDLNNFRSVFHYTSLGLWNTYQIGDAEIKNIKDDLPSIASFTPNELFWKKPSRSLGEREVLGFCKNPDSLRYVKTVLLESLKKYKNLKLFWDYTPDGEEGHRIYMINSEGNSTAPVTDRHLIKVVPGINPNGFIEISFELNEEGTEIWRQQTRNAANDAYRCIAIVIDDEVYSVPIVQTEIAMGKSSIAGGFDMETAQNLSQALSRSTRIPYPIEMIQETFGKR